MIQKYLFLCFVLILGSCVQSQKEKPKSTKTDYEQGLELMMKFRSVTDSAERMKIVNQAIPLLERVYFKDTANSTNVLLLGNAYFGRRDYQKAIYMYFLHKEQKPDFKEIDKNLAVSYRELGRKYQFMDNNPLHAKKSLTLADSIRPNDIETLELLGIANCALSKFDEGKAFYNRVLKMDPNRASTYFNFSLVFAKEGKFDLCQQYLDKANSIKPGFVNTYLERHKKGLPIYPQERPTQAPK
ncbi:MAG: hypothetical protein WAS56_08990 [Saprospiraceae bacterium]|nr:hypothetical protein [Saprospiraceae bacterium]